MSPRIEKIVRRAINLLVELHESNLELAERVELMTAPVGALIPGSRA